MFVALSASAAALSKQSNSPLDFSASAVAVWIELVAVLYCFTEYRWRRLPPQVRQWDARIKHVFGRKYRAAKAKAKHRQHHMRFSSKRAAEQAAPSVSIKESVGEGDGGGVMLRRRDSVSNFKQLAVVFTRIETVSLFADFVACEFRFFAFVVCCCFFVFFFLNIYIFLFL